MPLTWNELILSVCSLILTGLAGWAVTAFTTWMNDKLKDKKSQKYAQEALDIVVSCVKTTYQTYVEAIKGTDLWDKDAQEYAFQMSLNNAKAQLNLDVQSYIAENYGDLDGYLTSLIESVLYDLKN